MNWILTDGRARRGRLVFERGVVETPGLYARWHLRHRQRDDAGGGGSHRRADYSRQHLPPCGCARVRRSLKLHGDLHDFMQWKGTDPDRLRRFPGVQPWRYP
ncbi:hypothetical protein LNP74_02920 [Klebsiella pneumoniae subsp. pneumoniae]|nr:hypothetical protein [Klebsiella pneumoniae subsp. pneumoniae]